MNRPTGNTLWALVLRGLVIGFVPALCTGAELSERQVRLLNSSCVQCHARPDTGAPLMGQPEQWTHRVKRGEEALLRSVVEGTASMPPLGYCMACDESDFRVLIRLMAGREPTP